MIKALVFVRQTIQKIITIGLLLVTYVLGIGFMALFFRVFRISIVPKAAASSSWTTPTGGNNTERMY